MDNTNNIVQSPPSTCKCCDGKGWQVRNDGIKIICPACNGSGVFTPIGKITWSVPKPQPVYIVPNPCDEKPKPDFGWEFIPPTPPSPTFPDDPRNPSSWPWWRHSYVGDSPGDWEKPRNIC